ncbi:ABC transporter permease [Priestia endophytica]|jgi:osmoprotectant transport system permease protein|uniref:Amino acid ABC transporter permease n=2 Tax=Priestia endophytica TaxID=135735 RepID=A0AAX1Q3S7_9BACI|nr:ABC transporter permease [Priestia endophytica]MCM3536487.1 ABC transporter permease [Priestia endophytica]RAS72413.1 amino acid ABC transporter permease [Priestia endophytica]RAS83382.1 amino acid ABC transporter permease [Priestia endophytica]RAS90051.1 amino acid ABC transporter permease [Priestia endophytica]SFQ71936.1 osmoprotectant transport system permease protein [Priestia endophytica DSM 13796]
MNFIKELFGYWADNIDLLLLYTGEHLLMVIIAVGLALIVGTLLGIICSRYKRVAPIILTLANVVQVIPSLALLAVLMLYFGLGFYTVVIGLFLYSLLPIIRNTYVGLEEVDKTTVEAGHGIGMTYFQILTKVQLPLSMPFIMAGLRIAAVIAVGVATLAPIVGGDGLGREIFSGINSRNTIRIYAGAIPACIVAVIADILLGKLERKMKIKVTR